MRYTSLLYIKYKLNVEVSHDNILTLGLDEILIHDCLRSRSVDVRYIKLFESGRLKELTNKAKNLLVIPKSGRGSLTGAFN